MGWKLYLSGMTRLWHGFAAMGAVDGNEFVVSRGEGARVWDSAGREYLDASAGLWFVSVGYGRTEIADAAAAQMSKLAANHCFFDHANEPAIELADRIVEFSPFADGAVFFGSGGSEAVDTACKLARRFWSAQGRDQKTIIVSRQHGYHGMNAYGTSLAGIPANLEGYGVMIPETLRVSWDEPEDLEELLDRYDGRVAAYIGEPVIGAGGVIEAPEGYWKEIRRICTERDILFIQDEVICGFGRLGTNFGCMRYGVEPDLITFAKGVTSGYLPLGGVIAGPRVKDLFWAEGAPPFRHGFTYTGHAACCAAGLANLDILERERLVDRVAELEPVMAETFAPLADLDLVAEVRSVGLLTGIEFTPEVLAATPGFADKASVRSRENGVITRALRGVGLQVSPPFVSTPDELKGMADGMAAGIRQMEAVVS
jgi:adenosylmethionine-8-amino-7-oxononanoate aminotransferase